MSIPAKGFRVGTLIRIRLTKQHGFVTALMTDGVQTKTCVKHTNKDGEFIESWFLDWELEAIGEET